MRGPPTYLEELTCPCCIPALGEFSEVPPRGGSAPTVVEPRGRAEIRPPRPGSDRLGSGASPQVSSSTEDSHSGLVRTLGKRVESKLSGVQIPYPPPRPEPASSADEVGSVVPPGAPTGTAHSSHQQVRRPRAQRAPLGQVPPQGQGPVQRRSARRLHDEP